MAKIQGLKFDDRKVIEIVINDDEENPKVLTARIRDLPIDFGEQVKRRVRQPHPPRKPLRDKKGPIRDKDGRVVIQEDLHDEAFQRDQGVFQRRLGIATVIEALDDPSWEFDAERPAEDDGHQAWEDYYDAIHAELKAIRFPQRALIGLVRAINKSIGITEEEIAEVTRSF